MAQQPPLNMPTGPEKLKAVTELVNDLIEDLETAVYLPEGKHHLIDNRDRALEQLKLYSRDPRDADPIFTDEGITMLLKHSYHSPSTNTSRCALRVLANSMLLKPEMRQMFVDKGYTHNACKQLGTGDFDDEFLNSRILFLLTYGTNIDLKELIEKEQLADRIVDNLARHAKDVSSSKAKSDPMQNMALTETAKLLFNITHWCPEQASLFTPAVPHLAALLFKEDVSQSKPLDPPVGFIINGFLNLDLATEKSIAALYPKTEPEKVASRLISILDAGIRACPEHDLDAVVTPLIGLLNKVHEHAPDSAKQHIRNKLLPTAEDRENVLGKGDSLSAKLLKNSTNPVAPALRDAISHLLFDMSDKDAGKFVENVGYGFASGFLFQNNVPIPASASEAFNTGDTTGSQKPVNPVTGQFFDSEKPVNEPEMTEEEKQREAERLFVLFERSGFKNKLIPSPLGHNSDPMISIEDDESLVKITSDIIDHDHDEEHATPHSVKTRERAAPKKRSISESDTENSKQDSVKRKKPDTKRQRRARTTGSFTPRRSDRISSAASATEVDKPPRAKTRVKKSRGRPPTQTKTTSRGREVEWEVEKILDSQIDGQTSEHFYLVKWKGFASKENTWEPKKNLSNCRNLIQDFEKKAPKKR
ncbi:hypothetical protein F66182_10328 [Fusarium sp. NRRL 66182]|nr:hypothetical protein F66182_10328 [Fusarium sp. NRRL 66182]